jgi:hypothetical protein
MKTDQLGRSHSETWPSWITSGYLEHTEEMAGMTSGVCSLEAQ